MKLPIADSATVRAYTGVLFRKHRRPLILIAVLHTLAATAGLAGPWLLGMLVDALHHVAGQRRVAAGVEVLIQ